MERHQYRHLRTVQDDPHLDRRMTELGMYGWRLSLVTPDPAGGLWLFFERDVPEWATPEPPPVPTLATKAVHS